MAATPYHVAESFLAGKRDRAGAFTTDGSAIYSYALLLATRDNLEPHSITIEHPLDGSANVSVTTARHIRALREVLQREYPAISLIRGARLSRHNDHLASIVKEAAELKRARLSNN